MGAGAAQRVRPRLNDIRTSKQDFFERGDAFALIPAAGFPERGPHTKIPRQGWYLDVAFHGEAVDVGAADAVINGFSNILS
jgi:hypothetical protein